MEKMKMQRVESYDAGDVCEPTYNGYMVVENVSDSDVSPSDSCASKDESLTLDGDVAYVSSEQV